MLHVCLKMSRTKHPMSHHVAPRCRCCFVLGVSRETPDATPCHTSPPQGVEREQTRGLLTAGASLPGGLQIQAAALPGKTSK